MKRRIAYGALAALLFASPLRADSFQSVPLGAWTTYTPTCSASSPGATPPTFGTITGRYQITGKRVDISVSAPITANGTGSGFLQCSLPVPAQGATTTLAGQEAGQTAKLTQARVQGAGATVATILFYDATYPGGTGYNVTFAGSYEAQ